ncbi:uncharacterized protein LOC6573451 [Drosophila mojavensis]|uniref:DUF2428 domain-containing protein n=1 Tax=Drosophila mojavensis TaxID=7230 RepID=B4K4L7_DROMO|nr:uncharacterized protein LOC6573451 [Drosophila mojavensis]EDW14993.1 uncharacterized protein Dmoj_GI23024 [Drosophila mojavensis]
MAAAIPKGEKKSKSHNDCLSYLQSLGDGLPKEVADQLAAQIFEEANQSESLSINQAALNVSFRVYYHIVHKYELEDEHFANLPERLSYDQPQAFLMLQAVLLTNHWSRLDAQLIEAKCMDAIIAALQHNNSSLVHILKATNLLVKKFTKLQLLRLQLEHFYHCLQRQSQVGSREETLTLFNHCCKQQRRAFAYFRLIVEFWPWTNRNKYYLLSGILNSHGLPQLLAASGHNESEFFAGLRLSLSYKGLRAASQYPVKSLSSQRSAALLDLAVELLVNGNIAEIQNFHSQWFLRIQQRDALFQLLQGKPEIVEFLASSESARTASEQQRLILIFSMFAKEIYVASKLHFFKISTELLTNCSVFETEAQLLIFKFLVENLANFAVEDCLDFFYSFMKRHRGVESSEFRNTMLGKMPNIINHTAKHFSRALRADGGAGSDALANDIKRFFRQLQELLEQDILSDVYQPKIFALKMLEILHKSLYSTRVIKNAKMCSTQQNQQLGAFLLDHGVFQPKSVAQLLFKSLNDPQGFDDALELTVSLLLELGDVDSVQCNERCLTLCLSSDVDECSLVSLYAQLLVRSGADPQLTHSLYDQCLQQLTHKFDAFQLDPLKTTKTDGGHLFGHICVLDELVSGGRNSLEADVAELLPLLERILNVILKFLNLGNARQAKTEASAASFQDMDESLQLLVSESAYVVDEDDEACRKYLLMSFWLTLKASCDLATSLACALLRSAPAGMLDCEALQRCLDINVAVLTRCRHKGAIEAAGLSIGRLTRAITSTVASGDRAFELLHDCLERELLSECRQVSTTRRGAGFSIMFLHVVKNDDPRQRSLLHRAVQRILERLNGSSSDEAAGSSNHDRWEALALHYLCVLVRDTELRPAMCKYYNEIMLVAIEHIDHTEWTISNAALQLFGASLGKLLGQRQATEFDTKLEWEPSEMNYEELACQLPKACEHMLSCCSGTKATSSIILFLGFLSKVEHLCTTGQPQQSTQLLQRFRRLSWRLLRHRCEQVRQLAATCFVRAHEFRCDLPAVLLASAKKASQLKDDNFYEALLFTMQAGVLKLQHEARHVWTAERMQRYQLQLLTALAVDEQVARFKAYTLNVLLQLLTLLKATEQMAIVRQLLDARGRHALS